MFGCTQRIGSDGRNAGETLEKKWLPRRTRDARLGNRQQESGSRFSPPHTVFPVQGLGSGRGTFWYRRLGWLNAILHPRAPLDLDYGKNKWPSS